MDTLITLAAILCIFLIYKILDRLVRLPKVGNSENKYILVTGCGRGFGYAIAKHLDQIGCHVFATCSSEKGEIELKKQCSKRMRTMTMNVAKSSSVQKAFREVEKMLPPGKGLWGIINNAGIGGQGGPAEWLTLQNYQEVLDVNLLGLIDVTVTFLPLLKRDGGGRVVNTASMQGRCAFPYMAPYTISKYGVESFSDSLRRQLKMFNVSVHLIEPGFFKTNITNIESMKQALRRTWQQAPAHAQEDYGEAWLEKSLSQTSLIDDVASPRISDVVDAYEHALLGRYPRARYVVGKDARFFFIPINMCFPEWLSDWLMDKLQKGKPTPQAVLDGRYRQ